MWDPNSQDLAEHFLDSEQYTSETVSVHEQRVKSLASMIQQAVEDWFQVVDPDE